MATDRHEYMVQYRHNQKQKLLDELGGVCVQCGSANNLEFDHKIPGTRAFPIAFNLSHRNVDKELTKCQLLCHDCHRVKSDTEKAKGSKVWTAKLTEDKVHVIRELYATECKSYRLLAEEFDVTPMTIRNVVKRVTWKHI